MTDPYRYECPICGSELSATNFLTSERDYSCPVCATVEKPRAQKAGSDRLSSDPSSHPRTV